MTDKLVGLIHDIFSVGWLFVCLSD